MSYHTDAHRIFYVYYRKSANAPVMFAMKRNWGWVVEVKNTGELMFEQLKACCAWCAKAEGVKEWLRRKEEKENDPPR